MTRDCCCKATLKLNTSPQQPIKIDCYAGSPFLNMDSKDTGPMGPVGPTGNGIDRIEKTASSGLVDTYTIYYTDGTTSSFDVSNGEKGDTGPAGQNATINGVTTLSLDAKDGVSLIQEGQNATISGKSLQDGILSLQNIKQDKINDLDTIRSGASAGATAVQPNVMASAISTHNTSSQAHTDIRGLITTETTNRENADIGLQSQIDAIVASSDVTDIVGTYAQLQAYDTSSLPPNSIIKVLQDESQNNETTYYRWVITGGIGAWVLIGEEGPYYTKSEADERFATAAQGAKADTALQPSALNGYATETWVGQQGFLTSTALVGYATEQWVQNQGYLTSSSLSNYVTTNTNQTITGQKTFLRTEASFQDSVARFVSTYNSSNQGWRGRVIIGAKDYTFLIGTYNGMAAIGGHKFSDSATESNAAWSDIYFQPDGNKSIYMGGWDWTGGSGWFRVQNSGGNTGGKAQVNQGTIKNTDWKDVAYKGENISDFNNDAGYGTGTVKSVNSTSPDSNGNVSLNVGTFYWGE